MKRTASAKKSSNGSATSRKINGARKARGQHFAICVDNSAYPASLELHKLYRVLPDAEAAQDGDVRVIDESGEDYLYPAEWFVNVAFPPTITRALRTSFARHAQPA